MLSLHQSFSKPKKWKIICWPKNDLNHIDSNGCTCLNFKIDNVFINISLDSLDTKKMKQRPGHIVKYLKKQALNRSPPLCCKMVPPPTIPVQYEERSIVCFCLDVPLDILWPQFTTHTILGQQHLTSSERWSNKNPKQSSVISTCCCIMNWLRHIGALTTNHWWILRPWNKTIHGSWTRSPTVLFNIHLSESVFRGEIYIYIYIIIQTNKIDKYTYTYCITQDPGKSKLLYDALFWGKNPILNHPGSPFLGSENRGSSGISMTPPPSIVVIGLECEWPGCTLLGEGSSLYPPTSWCDNIPWLTKQPRHPQRLVGFRSARLGTAKCLFLES